MPSIPGAQTPYTRVAVVQLDYVPATPERLRNPLQELALSEAPPLTALVNAAPSLAEEAKELGERLRASYVAQLQNRVKVVLREAVNLGVEALLLPEYSIPPEILPQIAEQAPGVVIIAGSHSVDANSLRVLRQLGWDELPKLGQAISPVLYDRRIIGVQTKLRPARLELGTMVAGVEWGPIPLPGQVPGPLGVLICLDYLARGDSTTNFDRLAECRWLAAPSCTPEHTLNEFSSNLRQDARGRKLPVLFANHARFGGSGVFIDDDSISVPHAGPFSVREEGMLVADVHLGLERPGRHTSFDLTAGLRIVAKTSFVYASVEREYADWAVAAVRVLNQSKTELEVLDEFSEHLKQVPHAHEGPPSRARRLAFLSQELSSCPIESLSVATREVVFSEELLSPAAVSAALATSAADVLRRWRDGSRGRNPEHVTALDAALREFEGAERAGSSEVLRSAPKQSWLEITKAARGIDYLRPGGVLAAQLEKQEPLLSSQLQAKKATADEAFNQGNYEQALDAYTRTATEFQDVLAGDAPVPDGWRELAQGITLNRVACNINLQRPSAARDLLLSVPDKELPPRLRIQAAELYTALGDLVTAAAVLPSEADAHEHIHRLREARQLLEIEEGRLPKLLSDTPRVRLAAAAFLCSQKHFDHAFEHCVFASRLSLRSTDRLTLASVCVTLLQEELFSGTKDEHALTPIRRLELAQLCESTLSALGRDFQTTEQAGQIAHLSFLLSSLTRSPDPPLPHASRPELDDRIRALLMLARDGRCDEAIASIPETDHPWLNRMLEVDILQASGRDEQARVRVNALAEAFPGRVPILLAASDANARAGFVEQAVVFSEAARQEFPTPGIRLLKAELLLATGHDNDAEQLLEGLHENAQPKILRVLALCAERTNIRRAAELWKEYVVQRAEDARARLALARVLAAGGESVRAAEEAWLAADTGADQLSPKELRYCLAVQRLGSVRADELATRSNRIASLLNEHHSADPATHLVRLDLKEMGLDAGEGPIDFELLESAGYVSKHSTDELFELVSQGLNQAAAAEQLYRAGGIHMRALCSHLNVSPTALFAGWLDGSDVGRACCAPAHSTSEIGSLEGATLFLGHAELVLLTALAAFNSVRASLGSGKLVITASTFEGIVRERLERQGEATLTAAGEEASALAFLSDIPKGVGYAATASDLVSALANAGALDQDEERKLRHELGCAETDNEQPQVEPEGPIRIPVHLLLRFSALGQLSAMRSTFDGRLVRHDEDIPALQAQTAQKRREHSARALSIEVHEHVLQAQSEGWLTVVQDPPLADVGAVAPEGNSWLESLVLRPIQEHLAVVGLLEERPDWFWISLDFFGSIALGLPQLPGQLRWPSRREYLKQVRRARRVQKRVLHIPEVMRLLMPSSGTASKAVEALGRLGFADALTGDDLTALVSRFRSLDSQRVQECLDRAEWMARNGLHIGCDIAQLTLVKAYAHAMLDLACPDTGPGTMDLVAPDERNCTALLNRVQTVAEQSARNTIESLVLFLALHCVSHPERLGRRTATGWEFLGETPGHRLWSIIYHWADMEPKRRAAVDRAIAAAWVALADAREKGPSGVQVASLLEAHSFAHRTLARKSTGESIASVARGPDEALAILSATWEEKPLSATGLTIEVLNQTLDLSHEELLVMGARELENGRTSGDDRRVVFEWNPGENAKVLVEAALEALVLRASPEWLTSNVDALVRRHGRNDGGLADALLELATSPSSPQRRKAYARRAVLGLWRQVRDDPGHLVRWSQSIASGGSGRPSWNELRAILSEPEPSLRQEWAEADPECDVRQSPVDLARILLWRGERGVWRDRTDRATLYHSACCFPGALAAGSAVALFHGPQRDEFAVAAATDCVAWETLPCEELAVRIPFLRAFAEVSPTLSVDGELVNVRDRVSSVYEDILASTREGAEDRTAEGPLLRFCLQIVRVILYAGTADVVDALWLTYRLCHWLRGQLRTLSAAERHAAIENLRSIAPAPRPTEAKDLLDPTQFEPGPFAYRRTALLHAIALGEAWAAQLKRDRTHDPKVIESTSADTWQAVSSEATAALVALAATEAAGVPCTSTAFPWGLPNSIPDLAIFVLLQADCSNFLKLPSERRTALIAALPRAQSGTPSAANEFDALVLASACSVFEELSEPEQDEFERYVSEPEHVDGMRQLKWVAAAVAYLAGHLSMLAPAVAISRSVTQHETWSSVLPTILAGLLRYEPQKLTDSVNALATGASEAEVDAYSVVVALSQVDGDEHAITEAFDSLRGHASFAGDNRLAELLSRRAASTERQADDEE